MNIIHPLTQVKYNISDREGVSLLKKYINTYQKGGSGSYEEPNELRIAKIKGLIKNDHLNDELIYIVRTMGDKADSNNHVILADKFDELLQENPSLKKHNIFNPNNFNNKSFYLTLKTKNIEIIPGLDNIPLLPETTVTKSISSRSKSRRSKPWSNVYGLKSLELGVKDGVHVDRKFKCIDGKKNRQKCPPFKKIWEYPCYENGKCFREQGKKYGYVISNPN